MLFDLKLLPILIDNGKLSVKDADQIKVLTTNSGESIQDILLKKYLLTKDDILLALSKLYKLPAVSLVGRGISADLLALIPESVARKYKLIPFELNKKERKLHVAMTDPLDLPVIEFLEQKSGNRIAPCFAKEDDIISKINEEYSQSLSFEVTEALKESGEPAVKTITAAEIGNIIKEAPIAKIVSTILEFAVKKRASDVHIEPQELRTRVRYRIDGILHEKLALPRSVHDAVVSRIKILSDMKIDERRLPQDGRFNFKIESDEVDLRVSTLPTTHGEKVVMRLLRKTGGVPDLPELGLKGPTIKNIHLAITRPHGIILVTGPTGSGKTTTLYSILCRLNKPTVNIVTLEDPVEYEILGLNQVQINPVAGLTFASGLRSFLRQDPNIILVGEIRDSETTSLAIQAALTGHLVFSTLHTNNAATAIPRLLDLGAEPFLLVSVLTSVMAQRIVRKICVSCMQVYTPNLELVADIKQILGPLYPESNNGEVKLYKGMGCKDCNNTGYLGRVGIFEIIMITPAIIKLILERAQSSVIEKKAIEEGTITMLQDGYHKVLSGLTTVEEVLRVAKE